MLCKIVKLRNVIIFWKTHSQFIAINTFQQVETGACVAPCLLLTTLCKCLETDEAIFD